MASSNQFKTWAAGGGAYVLSPAAYAADAERPLGFPPGLVTKERLNTGLRQPGFVAAAVSQAIADAGSQAVNDDGIVANYVDAFRVGLRNMRAFSTFKPDTGVADAYVLTFDPPVTSYVNGYHFEFVAVNGNTGPATVNLGPGAFPLRRNDGGQLIAGDVPVGSIVSATYDAVGGYARITSIVVSQLGGATKARYVNHAQALTPGPIILVDTSGGPFSCPLPATGEGQGTSLELSDCTNTWATNYVTLVRNGAQTIMGLAEDLVVNVSDQRFTIWLNGTDWRLL